MYFDFDDLNEEIRVWMNVHDTKANKNLIAQMYGTVAEIFHAWRNSGKLLDEAGFIPGWCSTATSCGSIDYFVLVREAVERCRPTFFVKTQAMVHH
jgi:hypothetical protein